jgi:hypothetical protein
MSKEKVFNFKDKKGCCGESKVTSMHEMSSVNLKRISKAIHKTMQKYSIDMDTVMHALTLEFQFIHTAMMEKSGMVIKEMKINTPLGYVIIGLGDEDSE